MHINAMLMERYNSLVCKRQRDMQGRGALMRGGSNKRLTNGVISTLIVVFFLVHGALGALSALTGFSSPFTWLVWFGVALVGMHVIVSVLTSREQLTDEARPPSQRKKRHLTLKWATGALLVIAAAAHIVMMRAEGAASAQASVVGAATTALVAIALAVHVCVGAKSLLKDVRVDRRYMMAFRIVVCVFAAGFVVSAIAGVALSVQRMA